jgi:nucleoside-diphosphate-sugar epimerase
MVTPPLRQRFAVRIYDLRPPGGDCEYVAGDATDYPALLAAMTDVDVVIHAAMGALEQAVTAFDVNVKSVHLAVSAAHQAGVPHVVYVSSMSVYRELTTRRLDESAAPDACDLYGLTKRLGEEVCRAAVAEYGLSVNILRLAWPTPDSDWPAWSLMQPPANLRRPDGTPACATAGTDVAAAIAAAVDYRDGLQTFTVSADDLGGLWNTAKTRDLLGWRPEFSYESR